MAHRDTQPSAFVPPPPQNLDAEELVLSAMMLDPGAIDTSLETLEPDGWKKFYRHSHAIVYRACRRMHMEGTTVDPVTLRSFLDRHGRLEEAGGQERIRDIAILTPAVTSTKHYARIVNEQWAKRELSALLSGLHSQAMNGVSPMAVMEKAETGLLDARSRIERGGPSSVASMYELAEELEKRRANPPTEDGLIPAPFSFLAPLKPGRLYVVAGYTADGKTVIGVQYAKAVAKRGLRVGIFSIEMSKEQLFDRLISSFGVPLGDIERGRIKPLHRECYADALKEVIGWNIDVIDDRAANAATFHRYQRLRRYDLIVIDHLHEIALDGKGFDRRIMLEDEVRRITTVARTEHVPVVLLAQLSRAQGGGNPFPRPTPAMLRETARIEQSAAQVSFIWRHRDERNLPTDEAEFIVAKDRFGPNGAWPLRFLGDTVRFVETVRA